MIDNNNINDGGDAGGNSDFDPHAVQESQIRKMTRLAIEYQAVNLSQGACMRACICVCCFLCPNWAAVSSVAVRFNFVRV